MKHSIALALLVCLAPAAALQADPLLTFDDLPSNQVPVPSGYHGLNWSNLICLDGVTYASDPSGYQAGVVSYQNVIYGVGGTAAVISAGLFDFISAYATAAWNDNLQFEAKGYYHGTLLYDRTYVLSATSSNLITFNFMGVDEVHLTGSGGTRHSGYLGVGTEVVLDNISLTTYVPYAPPLMTNGGFETGDFSGWIQTGNLGNTEVVSNSLYVHSGTYGALLGPPGTPGFLAQEMHPLQVGQPYTLSFWLENSSPLAPSSFSALWGGYPVYTITNQPFGWTNIQLTEIAAGPTESAQFQFQNDPSFFGLDDVSVQPLLPVSNGGFETGTLAGWTPSGNSSRNEASPLAIATLAGAGGMEFAANGSPGSISQTVSTVPGQTYLLSFWLDSPDGSTPNQFQAQWAGQTLFNQTNLPAWGWTNLHFTVMNAATQAVLAFGGLDDLSALGLDEVTLVPVPLIQNGGFEMGDFTGWTLSGSTHYCFVDTNSVYAHTGFYGGQFGALGSLGYFSQTFATVPGQTYAIGFALDIPQGMTNAEFNAAWNGNILVDLTSGGPSPWSGYEFLVTATTTESTLKFGFRNDPSYFGMDDVYVSPLPLPMFQSIVKTNGLTQLAWSALPGYRYGWQYTTNLAHPNWITGYGPAYPLVIPMTGTDIAPPAVTRFYRLLMWPPLSPFFF